MQEIIFRGKSIAHHGKKEEWVYGYYSNYKGVNGRTHYISDDNGNSIAVREETVGQYTGLTDKNGTKIFEGDILKVFYYGKSKIFGVVRFGETRFFIDDNFKGGCIKAKAPMTEMFSRYEFEVVGNLHDNPELLD